MQSFLEACKAGNVGVVLELLEGGADPNQGDMVRGMRTVSDCLCLPVNVVAIIIIVYVCYNVHCFMRRITKLLFGGPVTMDMMRW